MSTDAPDDPFALFDRIRGDSSKPDDSPGQLGDFKVHKLIRGRMSEVRICTMPGERGEKLRIALKTFPPEHFLNPAFRSSFEKELIISLQLCGVAHVLPVFDVRLIEGRPHLMMLAAGEDDEPTSLAEWTEKRGYIPHAVLDFVIQIAEGMLAAREQIADLVHGDLKPENLLFLGQYLVISDFGLATLHSEAPFGQVTGTKKYLAPEITALKTGPTVAGDIFATGVILDELLSACRQSREPVPLFASLQILAQEMTDEDPTARPASWADVRDRLLTVAHEHAGIEREYLVAREAEYRKVFAPQLEQLRVFAWRSLNAHGHPWAVLEAASKLNPAEFESTERQVYASALALTDRHEEALAHYEQAFKSAPSKERAWSILNEYALSLKGLGRYDEARDVLQKLLYSVDASLELKVAGNLATVYCEEGNWTEARKVLEALSRKFPDSEHVWHNLGHTLRSLHNYDASIAAFSQALRLNPTNTNALTQLAYVYLEVRNVPVAHQCLERLLGQGEMNREVATIGMIMALITEDEALLNALRHRIVKVKGQDEYAAIEAKAKAEVARLFPSRK